jgi:catechol-2,3-dioxygenase
MSGPKRAIRGLGEIALRVEDLGRMQRFYEETIGLELSKRFPIPPSSESRMVMAVTLRS